MADEIVEVLELTLTKLNPEGAEATLTLADEKLVDETGDDSPLPEWLRGELAFDDIDIAYVDPAAGIDDDEDEEPEEKPLPPGLRVVVWIDMPAGEGDDAETFDRRGTIAIDTGHMDAEQAEGFAATFRKLAGREEPVVEEAPEAEAVEEAPTGAPEAEVAAADEPAADEPADEAPEDSAFAPAADSAFAAADDDDKPADSAFAAPEE